MQCARIARQRGRALDDHKGEVEKLLQDEPKISAKRIGRLLEKQHGVCMSAWSVRRYVEDVRGSVRTAEAFVHRTHRPGETMEIDFGETWCDISIKLHTSQKSFGKSPKHITGGNLKPDLWNMKIR